MYLAPRTVLVLTVCTLAVCGCKSSTGSSNLVETQVVTTPAPEGAIPAGTRLMVRTTQPLDSRRQGAGHRFNAVLEADLVGPDGAVVAKRGTTVYGQLAQAKQAGRLAGKTEMTIVLTDLLIDNKLTPIRTSAVQAVGEGAGKGTVGRVGAGAAIGGIANGSKGARRGAAIGLGTAVLTRGNQINIPAGTILDFQLADHLVR